MSANRSFNPTKKEEMPSNSNLNSEISNLAVSSETSTPKPIIQDSPIFDSALHHCLPRIINELDPASYVKLTRTCRAMSDICLRWMGIEVRFGVDPDDPRAKADPSSKVVALFVFEDETESEGFRFDIHAYKIDVNSPNRSLEGVIDKMIRMPFRLVIENVCFGHPEIGGRQMEALRHYLRRFPRLDLNGVQLDSGHHCDWNMFADFVQEFRVKRVDVFQVNPPIPEDRLLFFATNLLDFNYSGFVPDDVVLATTAKIVLFQDARISLDTFKQLFQKFVAGEISNWEIGRELPNLRGFDTFVTACSEAMRVEYVFHPHLVNKVPGVLYSSLLNPTEFFLLRTDGSHGRIRVGPMMISFF